MLWFTMEIMIKDLRAYCKFSVRTSLQCYLLCCAVVRSHLQVSVYRLRELTVDTAAGHAVYVSAGNKTPHTLRRIIPKLSLLPCLQA